MGMFDWVNGKNEPPKPIEPPKPGEWVCLQPDTLSGVTRALNKLTPEQAASAKVVAGSSSVNMGGWHYYIWYRV